MLLPSKHKQADRLVWGFTPLIAAVASKNLEVVNRLLAAGASVFIERQRDPIIKRKTQAGSNGEKTYESTAINYAQVCAYCCCVHAANMRGSRLGDLASFHSIAYYCAHKNLPAFCCCRYMIIMSRQVFLFYSPFWLQQRSSNLKQGLNRKTKFTNSGR